MNATRRDFLRKSVMGSALLALGGSSLTSCDTPHRIQKLGLITGVIREEIEADYRQTLRRVADIGYCYLEIGNYLGPSMEDFKAFLKEINLKAIAGGTSIADMMDIDDLKRKVEEALAMGKEYFICYWPWLDGGENKTLDDFRAASERLNRVGRHCKEMGIKFALHNHDKEFVPVEGYKWGYEVMLQDTEPDIVDMQLDLYWMIKGGGDPFYFFNMYPGRFKLFHVKDMEDTPEKLYTCPGYGVIDFTKIFAKSKEAGVIYYIVEIDRHPEPMQCIEDSYRHLMQLRF